jgi:hypothetical protein
MVSREREANSSPEQIIKAFDVTFRKLSSRTET